MVVKKLIFINPLRPKNSCNTAASRIPAFFEFVFQLSLHFPIGQYFRIEILNCFSVFRS